MKYAMCPAGCGCLWRNNGDGTMSLAGPNSKSCAVCEVLPWYELILLGPVEINLGKGDKLVADIHQDDVYGTICKAGVGIFAPEPGKIYGIGVKENCIDGLPITADRNPLVLIWSDKPESLQVIIDELQEAINHLKAAPNDSPV